MILCLGTTPTVQRTMFFKRMEIGAVNRALSVTETASGKSLNVARVLATLASPCLALGFAGGDTGSFLRHDLERSGLSHELIDTPASTRTCTTIIDESTNEITELVQESNPVEPSAWTSMRERFARHLAKATLVVLSGSLPPGADESFYAWCIERAREHQIDCIVDASGQPLRLSLAARPTVVKPNRSELAKTLNMDIASDAQLKSAIAELISLGPAWAIVTMGAEGAVISDGQAFWRIAPPPIRVVSPIGSGDAFAAGVAAALTRGETLPQAARLGAACAAANAMIPVAGFLRPDDVERLLSQITLTPW